MAKWKQRRQLNMFPREKHDQPLLVGFTEPELKALRSAAFDAKVSMAEYVRRAVAAYVLERARAKKVSFT